MNRHRRYALLAPLLVSSVALPPTTAAQAAPADRPPAALSAPAGPSCKLEVAPGTKPVEFDLVLTGFKAGERVQIEGPKRFTGVINGQGKFDEENVPRGNYTVITGNKKTRNRIACEKPPRTPAAPALDVTDADAKAIAPTGPVDCAKPQDVKFQGTLTGTGTGTVKYVWNGPNGKQSAPSVEFTQPSTNTTVFTVTAPPRAAAADPPPKVTVRLSVPKQGPEQGISSGDVTFTLQCT
ncbi:hypothetical protein [Streptomyces sp. SD15]